MTLMMQKTIFRRGDLYIYMVSSNCTRNLMCLYVCNNLLHSAQDGIPHPIVWQTHTSLPRIQRWHHWELDWGPKQNQAKAHHFGILS